MTKFKVNDFVSLIKNRKTKGIVIGFSKVKKYVVVSWLENARDISSGNFSPERLCRWVPDDRYRVCKKLRRLDTNSIREQLTNRKKQVLNASWR